MNESKKLYQHRLETAVLFLCHFGGGVHAEAEKIQAHQVYGEDPHYDKDAADYAVMFIESLCHTKGTMESPLN